MSITQASQQGAYLKHGTKEMASLKNTVAMLTCTVHRRMRAAVG